MKQDLRTAPFLGHKEILALNFIRAPGLYVFRRHYRTGLRSHIMEVLRRDDVHRETRGVMIDGLKTYPRAEPVKILRLFRTRFGSLQEAEEELKRVKFLQSYLSPDHVARSEEFLVDYGRDKNRDCLLCGLQEYVKGEILEPWGQLNVNDLASRFFDMSNAKKDGTLTNSVQWIKGVRHKAGLFIAKLKKLITETGHVPDLAGVGNLILAPSGHIKLVDINNISKISFCGPIPLDDRGYPVCDKSMRVIWHLECKLAGKMPKKSDPIYATFLDPERLRQVKALEESFQLSLAMEDNDS